MKVAFATTDGCLIDEHFGRAGASPCSILRRRATRGCRTWSLPKAGMMRSRAPVDRATLTTAPSSGGRAALRLPSRLHDGHRRPLGGPDGPAGDHAGQGPERTVIVEAAEKLLQQIRTAPPPWLRLALNAHAEEPHATKGDAR